MKYFTWRMDRCVVACVSVQTDKEHQVATVIRVM